MICEFYLSETYSLKGQRLEKKRWEDGKGELRCNNQMQYVTPDWTSTGQ